MTITGQSALPKEDIDRMVSDAEQYAAEDAKRRQEAEARNTADSLLYRTDKLVTDNGEQIPADLKAKLEEAQTGLREAMGGDDVEAITTKSDDLMRLSQEVGQAIYAAGAADQAGAQTAASATPEDDDDTIVDAEVVEDDDDTDRS